MINSKNNPADNGNGDGMNVSALLDEHISSADFAILSTQMSANPSLFDSLKTQQYVSDALAGFSSPDYCYTERIMCFIREKTAVQ